MTDADLTQQARDEACVFCAIVEGRAPRVLRREWDDALALVPLNPVTPGHTLIIPKAHVANYAEDPNVTAAVMRHAAEYAPAGASNLITSMGRAATQSVWHLHVHVIPRVWGDGLALPWDPAHAALSAELAGAKAEIERLRAECDRAWDVAVEERLRRLEAQAGIESPPEPEPDPLAGRLPAQVEYGLVWDDRGPATDTFPTVEQARAAARGFDETAQVVRIETWLVADEGRAEA